MIRRSGLVAVALLGLVLLTGCDRHAAALARPAGESIERVRMATIDVVIEKGYSILEAPVCQDTDDTVTCRGTTIDGLAIESTSPEANRDDVSVTVDGTKLYDGAVATVLEDAARAS